MFEELPPELIESYLIRRKKDVETLREALSKNSVMEFQRIGHQLAGNASNFGFPDLEELGRKMEALTEKDFKSHAQPLFENFQNWLSSPRR